MRMDIVTGYGNIPLEELAKLPTYMGVKLSFDRKKIAFYYDKSGQHELYLLEAKPGAEPKQLSNGELPRTPRSMPIWSRDDAYIYFSKDDDGDEQHNIWRIDAETGETEQLTDTPNTQEYPIDISPDDKTLLIAANLEGQMNLFAFDLETKERTRLTNYQFPVTGATYSPDGKTIAYMANETTHMKNSDLYLMNADGSDQKKILSVKEGSQDSMSDWSPDGRYLAVSTDASGMNQAGIYDLESGEARWITPEDKTTYPGSVSPDGKRLLTIISEHSMANVQIWDVESGDEIPVELPPGMSFGSNWLNNNEIYVNIVTDVSRPELRTYRLSDGASETLLPAEYGSIDPAQFTSLEYVSYPSLDGLTIHANLYRPRELEPGKKYPALVEIHGGPTAQFERGFNPRSQFLTDHGYIIIQPNVRGSTGYGVEFRDMALNDWGGRDLDDVEGAVNYLKSLPEVDTDRIGVFGGSYGGYMTFMAVTKKPDLWKAGVAVVGISDLKKLYDSSMEHFKYYLTQQMGNPEENAELWEDRSAVNFAHQMKAHLLILHGVNDPRCPIEQARVFRDKLIEHGKVEGEDFEYIEQGAQGHGSADIGQKTETYKILLDYFQRKL